MKKSLCAAALGVAAQMLPVTAQAAPGLAGEVYSARTNRGEFEVEAISGVLAGGPDAGENAVKLEFAYSPSSRLRVATFVEIEREPGGPRKAEEAGVETMLALGQVAGIDVGFYGEYGIGLNGNSDVLEGKLLLEKRSGKFDARLNLIAEKPLTQGAPVEVSYAAAVEYAVAGDAFKVGAKAFGGLGTFRDFAPRAEHFIGPVAFTEIEGLGPEIDVEIGYLFAFGKARDDTKGQFRLVLETEF
ncbi:hypothetical protein [Novosphingobium cyanobacteriorum]|uniref:Secreted protein n=1 Tax=Novosphingobium cyanobacteriorum TaxID=3024215 RepID=A0ABT6CEB1_9SPHN|nr:hypothetical protein [Novosphingobium cyanobacteriorum]MDF8332255.1 hypothetical protein [Novosphingobium cyanobacteriorum]